MKAFIALLAPRGATSASTSCKLECCSIVATLFCFIPLRFAPFLPQRLNEVYTYACRILFGFFFICDVYHAFVCDSQMPTFVRCMHGHSYSRYVQVCENIPMKDYLLEMINTYTPHHYLLKTVAWKF